MPLSCQWFPNTNQAEIPQRHLRPSMAPARRTRPRYGEGYYCCRLRDPVGNKGHLVFRGDIGG